MKKPILLLTLLSFFPFSGCSQSSKEQIFWKWFQANEVRLFDFEMDQNNLFSELNVQLDRVEPGLTFEFGPKENGKREFVISADGIRTRFKSVIALGDAAPLLTRWKVTKFRPRRKVEGVLKREGVEIAPDQVEFTLESDAEKVGITLFIEGLNENQREKYIAVAFLMLDHAIGEFDMETKVGFIEFKSKSEKSTLLKQPFQLFVETFDRFHNIPGK